MEEIDLKRAGVTLDDFTVILYHKNCMDGTASAWVAWKRLGDKARYIALDYDKVPDLTGEVVACVDFSMKQASFIKAREQAKFICVVDHHARVIKELEGFDDVLVRPENSGCVLAWRFFHPETDTPPFLKFIEDRDLWRWKHLHTKHYWAFLHAYPKEIEAYNTALQIPMSDAIRDGVKQYRLFTTILDQIAQNAHHSSILGVDAIMVNAPVYMSEIGAHLAKPYHAVAIWFGPDKHGNVKVSLRGDGSVDCNLLAQAFGGGGHPNASGFSLEFHKLQDFLKGYL